MRALLAAPAGSQSRLPGALAAEGVICDLIEDLPDLGCTAALSGPFDIVLMDVAGLRRDAAAALQDLRRRGLTVPAIVLCSGLAGADEEALLHAGADHVLLHPVRPAALFARMTSSIRRAGGHACGMLRCGELRLDQQLRSANFLDQPVRLTSREYDVLEALMLQRGRLVTKQRLVATLYGGEDGRGHRIIDVFVCKLRRRLDQVGGNGLIQTVRGQGYILVDPAPVARRSSEASAHSRSAA